MSVARSEGPRRLLPALRRRVDELAADEARLWRLCRRFVVAGVLLLAACVAFYAYDHYWVSVESPLDQAVAALEVSVRQSPNDAEARLRVANAYARKKRYSEAVEQYQEALNLRKNWQAALLGMAVTEVERGDERRAEEIYRQVADLNRDNEFRYANPDLAVV